MSRTVAPSQREEMLKLTRAKKIAANQRAERVAANQKKKSYSIGEQNSLNQSDNKRNVLGNEEPQPIRGEESDSKLEDKHICLLIRFKVAWQVLSNEMW